VASTLRCSAAAADTVQLGWFMTGRVEIAASIAGLEVVTKIAWYYLHERVWADIQWGRRR
jgi:uncharacterized membrane protein